MTKHRRRGNSARKPQPGWAWMIRDHEEANGPFESRREAVEDAKAHEGDPLPERVLIGRAVYPDPAECLPNPVDIMQYLMERMEELAPDDAFYSEGGIFRHTKGAVDSLNEALSRWARKHVRATQFTFRETTEKEIAKAMSEEEE